jgi:hypothetical protein
MHDHDSHLEAAYEDRFEMPESPEELADGYPDLDDEPHDEIVAQQELEDFEQADEYFGFYGGEDDWG